MAKKLSPGEFPSITDWIKQFVGDGDVEPERKNYKIEIVQPENGTIGCNYAIAHAADPIVCTFTPNDGYQVVGFYVNGEESKLEFSMPAKDITITGKTEWIIYGTLEAPEISITYKDATQIIYSVKNPNDAEVKFNGETINPGSALELTHIWGSSEESFLIDGYLEAEHWINSPEVSEIVYRYSQGLKFTAYSKYALLTGIGTCTDTDITVPPTYNGVPVTQLYKEVFENNTSITSFKSESITSVGNDCFRSCTSLTSIDISNVTTLGDSCFYKCRFVDGITIPASVTSISRPFGAAEGFDVYCYMTSTTTKATTANQGWFDVYMRSSPTLHMLKTFDETTARETFGEYYDSHEISRGKPIVVFDLDPQE